jgi:hypothetical protein
MPDREPVNAMNRYLLALGVALALAGWTTRATAQTMVQAKDGSGVFGYKHTPVLPWCGYHVHDPDRPLPKRVEPGPAQPPVPPPSDAVVLFDGKDLDAWQPSDYSVVDGCMVAGDSQLTSKRRFGSCQIHLEWNGPPLNDGPWYNQGNNGVFLMGLYEIQIFDSLNVKIYPDGMAGSIYGQTPPLVNACRKPGEWQSFDIVLKAPVIENGTQVKPPRVTVFQNGVLVQLDEEIHGPTGHAALPGPPPKLADGPLVLGGHHCPVRFRNIWVRPLDTPAAH